MCMVDENSDVERDRWQVAEGELVEGKEMREVRRTSADGKALWEEV